VPDPCSLDTVLVDVDNTVADVDDTVVDVDTVGADCRKVVLAALGVAGCATFASLAVLSCLSAIAVAFLAIPVDDLGVEALNPFVPIVVSVRFLRLRCQAGPSRFARFWKGLLKQQRRAAVDTEAAGNGSVWTRGTRLVMARDCRRPAD